MPSSGLTIVEDKFAPSSPQRIRGEVHLREPLDTKKNMFSKEKNNYMKCTQIYSHATHQGHHPLACLANMESQIP
jgi:hypothetical protein